MRILLVEDERITALSTTRMLTRMGHEVSACVATGEDAVTAALEHRPDCILMDINLEGEMSGIDASRVIKRHLPTPLVYVTAYTDPDTRRKADATEPAAYLVKPVAHKLLKATLDSLGVLGPGPANA